MGIKHYLLKGRKADEIDFELSELPYGVYSESIMNYKRFEESNNKRNQKFFGKSVKEALFF